MSERIRVEFTRAEYDAVMARLRVPFEGERDRMGAPTVGSMDLQDAVRRMEAANRPLKIVS